MRSPHSLMCSKSIRASFLDYFCRLQGHTHVKSSPVVPYCDSSIAFINSGMCQFKNIFLGLSPAPHPRVANSQKCIRVGGKHNDLACAGRDSYHHTFFEMLGNWSFNDYYKRDACRMALEYLTQPPLSLPLSRLYFTYFGGCEALGLPSDEETRDLWRELGVPSAQIKREGVASNFWEMGSTGPCGGSTEIHYDLRGDSATALARVNANVSDLIEIWNIVFIAYNRQGPDSIIPLSKKFVDTGLGFERLVTILQDKRSTYDTDLFVTLLDTIHKASGATPYAGSFTGGSATDLDTSYRILSDYARMITVALADNMFPDATAKLRNVVRDALVISEDVFRVKQGQLLKELTYRIAEILGDSYPEIQEGLTRIQLIIGEEARIFDTLRSGALRDWEVLVQSQPELNRFNIMEEPGLVSGVKYLTKQMPREPGAMSGHTAFTLYDTHGLSRSVIEQLAEANTLILDKEGFEENLTQLKAKSKEKSATNLPDIDPGDVRDMPVTDDTYKYEYQYDASSQSYIFPSLETQLVGIVLDGEVYRVDTQGIHHARSGTTSPSLHLEPRMWVGLIFDSTNLYTRAGGQMDDIGVATLTNPATRESTIVEIGELATLEGRIVHFGTVASSIQVTHMLLSRIAVDSRMRAGCMRAHTTTHLINAALRRVLTCTYQKSCRVLSDVCSLDFSVYGETLSLDSVAALEAHINDYITRGVPVDRRHVTASELTSLSHVTVIPGEVYPDDVTLIDISDGQGVVSQEPCCGTHVHNTAHIGSCTILGYKSHNHGVRSVKCVTGDSSRAAVHNGKYISSQVQALDLAISSNTPHTEEATLAQQSQDLKELKKLMLSEAMEIPYVVQKTTELRVAELSKTVKIMLRQSSKTRLTGALLEGCRGDLPYLVHFVKDDHLEVQSLPPLADLTKPCLVIVYSSGELKARAYVPPQDANSGFNAQAWLTPLLARTQGKGLANKGVDSKHMYSMGGVRIAPGQVDKVVNELMSIARAVVEGTWQDQQCKV